MSVPVGVAVAAASLVGGVVVGTFSVVVHGWTWGLVLALAATAATLPALPAGWARLPFALGWTAAVGLLSIARPEGDFLVAQDTRGVVLVVSAPAVIAAGFVGLLNRRAAPP
ncbi:hypothetical protein [Nocardioides panacisoli]|uniref:Histidine kinase n=1 Tax=Nocardioides panacisoli TaxID=627624 RepID=A0ABP7HUY6_9ACTN